MLLIEPSRLLSAATIFPFTVIDDPPPLIPCSPVAYAITDSIPPALVLKASISAPPLARYAVPSLATISTFFSNLILEAKLPKLP